MEIEQMLEGVYDLHVHTGPDVMNRKLDDLEMAERMRNLGMKGFVIKSHYFCSAERARLTRKLVPEVQAMGAIVLNNSVGGLNPMAVEMAARDGAKVVWMPTFDAENEQEHFRKGKHKKLPYWAMLQQELLAQGKTASSITLLEGSNLKKVVYDVLDIISYHDLILATGHLGWEEIFALVKAARDKNIKKIVITHPNFPSVNLSKEQQKTLADLGAFHEHVFTTPYTNKITWETMYEQIRYVGPEKCILSTDLGQPNSLYPDEGMKMFISNLLSNGFSKEEVQRMTKENPAYLVES